MKDYKINGSVVDITLDSGKVVKCSTKWVEQSMKSLDTDMDDVILMFLEDNDYLVNEEQDELDKQAKGKVKNVVTSATPKAKTQRERVVKENPTKELIITTINNALQTLDGIENLTIENKAKIVTFSLNGEEFKVDLVQKRKKKE